MLHGLLLFVAALGLGVSACGEAAAQSTTILSGPLAKLDIKPAQIEARGTPKGTLTGAMLRITRSGMLDVLGSDYIKLVRLKGVPEPMVVAKHALKNSMIPVLTFAGLNLLIMVNVAVVIEVIFNWPGVGQLLYDALSNRDFPMVQGVVLMSGLLIVLLNFTIDVLYGCVDPRIRLSR